MPKIQIGPLEFQSKATAKSFFQSLRDKYADGEYISDVDAAFLHALIACHPEAEQKIGCGVSKFFVQRDSQFGKTRHFVLIRADNTSTDFSFHCCIDGSNSRKDKLIALRREIEDQIIDFRDRMFSLGPVLCPFLAVELTPLTCHVDHTPPQTFMRLVDEWMLQDHVTYESLKITPPLDNQIVAQMIDPEQKERWRTFHLQNARLRILSPLANLSYAKRTQEYQF